MSEEEMNEISGGLTLAPTKKFIAENPDEIVTTLKFPSDREDGQPVHTPVTRKYQSDNDEYAVTQKYPSDSDDHWLATTPIPTDSVE